MLFHSWFNNLCDVPAASNQVRIPRRTSDLAFTTSKGFQKSIMIPREAEWFCNLADLKSADPGKGSRLEDAHVSMRSRRTSTATRNFAWTATAELDCSQNDYPHLSMMQKPRRREKNTSKRKKGSPQRWPGRTIVLIVAIKSVRHSN